MPVSGDPLLFQLFMQLFMKAFEDQYRGHEDYRIIKDKVTREGVIGCDVQVKKKSPSDGSHVFWFDGQAYEFDKLCFSEPLVEFSQGFFVVCFGFFGVILFPGFIQVFFDSEHEFFHFFLGYFLKFFAEPA